MFHDELLAKDDRAAVKRSSEQDLSSLFLMPAMTTHLCSCESALTPQNEAPQLCPVSTHPNTVVNV